LLATTQEWWTRYFESDLAKATFQPTDLHTVTRLAQVLDAFDRATAALHRIGPPLSEGHRGQERLHPLARYALQLSDEARQLEDRLGANPRARLSLGLQLTEARRSLPDLYAGPPRPLTILNGDDF